MKPVTIYHPWYYTPIAGRIIVCDSGALCTLNYGKMGYRSVPRPIYPLDEMPL